MPRFMRRQQSLLMSFYDPTILEIFGTTLLLTVRWTFISLMSNCATLVEPMQLLG